MKDKDIYIGTIKKCISAHYYKLYGDEKYFPTARINNIEFGEMEHFTKKITEQAILIKVTKDKFIWLDDLESFKDELLVNIGIPIKVINTTPSYDNELFVDKKSLIPFFENTENKNLSVGKLRKKVLVDPRIKFGIEN